MVKLASVSGNGGIDQLILSQPHLKVITKIKAAHYYGESFSHSPICNLELEVCSDLDLGLTTTNKLRIIIKLRFKSRLGEDQVSCHKAQTKKLKTLHKNFLGAFQSDGTMMGEPLSTLLPDKFSRRTFSTGALTSSLWSLAAPSNTILRWRFNQNKELI